MLREVHLRVTRVQGAQQRLIAPNDGNGAYDPNQPPPEGDEYYDDDEYGDDYEPVGPDDQYPADYYPPPPVPAGSQAVRPPETGGPEVG